MHKLKLLKRKPSTYILQQSWALGEKLNLIV